MPPIRRKFGTVICREVGREQSHHRVPTYNPCLISFWVNLGRIGRAPAQPLRVGPTSSLVLLLRSVAQLISIFLMGHPCSDQKSFEGLFWEWSRHYLYSRADQSRVQPAMEQSVGNATVPGTRFANAIFSLASTMGFGRSSGARLQSACNLHGLRGFSGMDAYGLQVIFAKRQHPYDRQSTLLPRALDGGRGRD